MADSFTSLLVDLFTMLPAVDGQELFDTLHKVYPTPLDAKRSLEMVYYEYSAWRRRCLDGATAFSMTHHTTFFPSEPPLEGFEHELEEASRRYGYISSHHHSAARPEPHCDCERTEILQLCRTQCSVSTSHISFLENLHKALQEANGPFQFQLQLLTAQVSNCFSYDWAHPAPVFIYNRRRCGYGGFNPRESVLACNDIGSALQALKAMWMFSMTPESVLSLLESLQDHASPQIFNIMYDILISVLNCAAYLHMHIFELIHKFTLKPGYILHAVNVVTCGISGKNQDSDECRITFIQCAEALGTSYNQHKALGADEETLFKLRCNAVDLLHQAVSISVAMSPQLESVYQSSSIGVDVLSLMQVVCDSGEDALADLLAVVVIHPGGCLLQTLKKMDQLGDYYFKDGGPSKPLQVYPFKKMVLSLLKRRKNKIQTLADLHGDSGKVRKRIVDLQACFKFVGVEENISTFLSRKRLHPYSKKGKMTSKRLRVHMEKQPEESCQ